MVEHILSVVSQFIMHTESAMGYPGLVLLMAIASCCIPLPSEVIVPFAGYLCTTHQFSFWLVVAMGTVGSILGSIPAYYLGKCGGRPLVVKYGRYLLIECKASSTSVNSDASGPAQATITLQPRDARSRAYRA